MHHTEEHVARLVVLLPDVGFHRLGEGHVAGLVALHDLAALFIDDDDVVVFVNNTHDGVTYSCRRRSE